MRRPDQETPEIPPFRGYLFDLDGTLIDTVGLIVACFRKILKEEAGLEISRADIMPHIGLPLNAQYRIYLEPIGRLSEMKRFTEAHMDLQLDIWPDYVKCHEGAIETLSALKKRGARLALVTSRRIRTTRLFIEAFGLAEFLDVLCTPENTGKHKPHPEPAHWAAGKLGLATAETLFIGDARYDIQCGHDAGCRTALVGWGYLGEAAGGLEPDYILNRLTDLLNQSAF